jgi:hypothetical protein
MSENDIVNELSYKRFNADFYTDTLFTVRLISIECQVITVRVTVAKLHCQ